MSEFLIYFQIGLKHVLDIHAYDHVLFLIALVVPFSFKDWKRIILLITLFDRSYSSFIAFCIWYYRR
jgi:hypothetical protein